MLPTFTTSLRSSLLIALFSFLFVESFSQTPTPCTLTCPGNITVSNTTGQCGANVTYNVSSSGTCGTITATPASGSFFNVGTTTVNVSSTLNGSSTTGRTCSFTVTVNDVEPPVITSVTASPNVLWAPNHKMVPVTVTITSHDNCGIANCKIVNVNAVTSNEPVNGLGDGNTSPDWVRVSDNQVNLRAERSGKGNGRVYTIHVQCTDIHGNTSYSSVNVTVPHDMSSNGKGGRLSLKLNSVASAFSLFVGSEDNGRVTLTVTDINGRPVERRENIQPNQNITIGGNYHPGIYLISIVQGNETKQLKVIKQN